MAKKEKSSGGGILELIKTLAYALILAGLIRTLLFQPFWIPSGSMKQTLLIGDFLFVNKFAYGYSAYSCPSIAGVDFCGALADREGRLLGSDPERGDVVVFRHPVSGEDYIKRLIGLPGDTIEIRDGGIILNGEPVQQVADGFFTETYEQQGPARSLPRCLRNGPVGLGGECVKERAIETLPNGVSYPVLNIGETAADNRGPFEVPEGHFFFMGDNRDNSVDSRFSQAANGVGMVPLRNLIGRADLILFSSAGSSIIHFWTWRADRFFMLVE
ncbi:signal peptidase I [Halovulum dunhuangense]|uniref:Signal peptidase I n=1 Tax=Halovulum dunhuangense TaxID=1505036 RepID=A0A849L5L9_9RHOB|nr:signal peptidase I [Halovulum dunhuangense]NNU81553.1 signal peptidase I [Halovulum dunhuangense]